MLKVTRYLNGKEIKEEDLGNIVMDNELIHEIIADVNRRIKENFTNEQNRVKIVEKDIAM